MRLDMKAVLSHLVVHQSTVDTLEAVHQTMSSDEQDLGATE
jgi:hypothetical protein